MSALENCSETASGIGRVPNQLAISARFIASFRWNCSETALELLWNCSGTASGKQNLHLVILTKIRIPNRRKTAPKLLRNCSETAPKLHCNRTETALKLPNILLPKPLDHCSETALELLWTHHWNTPREIMHATQFQRHWRIINIRSTIIGPKPMASWNATSAGRFVYYSATRKRSKVNSCSPKPSRCHPTQTARAFLNNPNNPKETRNKRERKKWWW